VLFRDREHGALHLAEFTDTGMDRANATYEVVMADCVVVIAKAAQGDRNCADHFYVPRRNETGPLCAEADITRRLRTAFKRFANVDLFGYGGKWSGR